MRPVHMVFCRVLLCGTLLLAIHGGAGALPAGAAQLTEDYTLFYYLIEMQRRYKKECAGIPMPEAPSLTPSDPLRKLALDSISSGIPLDSLAAANLPGVPFQVLTAPGRTPQQAFDALYAGQCSSLMRPEYRYIGAASTGDRWLLLLAAGESGAAAVPVSAPQDGGEAPAAGSAGTAPAAPVSGAGVPASDPAAPAAPVVLYELEVDHRGQARFPQGTPPAATGMSTGPDLPPGGAGSVSDPAAPAAPIVAGEYEVDHQGRLVPPSSPDVSRREGLLAPIPQAGGSAGVVPPPPVFSPGPVSGPETPQARPGVVPLSDERPMPPPGTPVVPVDAPASTLPVGGAPQAGAVFAGSGDAGALLERINEMRASGPLCGGTRLPAAGPLRFNPQLADAARMHVADMAGRGYFSGTSPDGTTLGKRVTGAGYMWGLVAGNIASLRGDESQVLRQWLSQEEQCGNLAAAELQDAGAAYDAASGLWSVILATPLEVESGRPER